MLQARTQIAQEGLIRTVQTIGSHRRGGQGTDWTVGGDGRTGPVSTIIGRRRNLTYQTPSEYYTTNLIRTEPELKRDRPCIY